MSRSAEEQLLLDQRIQAMKQKNEALRRRHLEVEADKRSAAEQNALVRMNVPHDDDWVPGRHDDTPRQERSHQQSDPSSPPSQERSEERGQWYDQRRRNEGRRDNGPSINRQYEDADSNARPIQSVQFSRRSDNVRNQQKFDEDRTSGNENRRSGDWANRSNDSSGGRQRDWFPQSNRGYRGNTPSGSGESPRGYTSTFTSKVFKNSSMDQERGKRPAYRLAEGDGPPPDPSYSFLGDSMRDSPESSDRRRGNPRRGFPRGRGRGGQTWNNRGSNDSPNGGFEDRGEVHLKHNEDLRHEEWRRERSKIDQDRINRQKTSDGNWSREWDSNKVLQEGNDRPHHWRKGNQTQNSGYSQPRRGHPEDAGNTSRHNYVEREDSTANPPSSEYRSDDAHSPSRTKTPRRGRFAHQQRFKDSSRFNNGSNQHTPSKEQIVTTESKDAVLIDANVKAVEKLQVSLICDPSGTSRRSVEGVGGHLRVSVSNDGELSDSKNVEQKRQRKNVRKGKRNRVISSTSTGTTETGDEDDGSWEDLSSDEDVSVLTDLGKVPRSDTAKCVDVSSGPESLDPIPAPGKEDEFLWDDFHPAGFQDNVTLNLEAEAAYQALLDEQAKQVAAETNSQDQAESMSAQPHQISFKLDTACLDDSNDETEGAKLDPLLVTTQIVQAEVDCMSLTSIPTDTSLPDDVSQFGKVKAVEENKALELEAGVSRATVPVLESFVSAEDLSGPVSILDVPSVEQLTASSNLIAETESCVEAVEIKKSHTDIGAPVSSINKVNLDSAKSQSEESVIEESNVPQAALCEGDVKSKEVAANTLAEQGKINETEESSVETSSPLEEEIEKCVVEGAGQSAYCISQEKAADEVNVPQKIVCENDTKSSTEVLEEGEHEEENKGNTSVADLPSGTKCDEKCGMSISQSSSTSEQDNSGTSDSIPVGCTSSTKEIKSKSIEDGVDAEDKEQLAVPNSARDQQEQIVETCNGQKIDCEGIGEEKSKLDVSSSPINDASQDK